MNVDMSVNSENVQKMLNLNKFYVKESLSYEKDRCEEWTGRHLLVTV